jgi:hypothetical protein
MHERLRRSAPPGAAHVGPPPLDADADALAEHIYRFSLAGLRAMRRKTGTERRRAKESGS